MSRSPVKVLLLEDDAELRQLLAKYLERKSDDLLEVTIAAHAAECRQFLDENPAGKYDVLITDIMMPDGQPGGLVLAREMIGRLPVIVISGHPINDFADLTSDIGAVVFLEKGPQLHERLRDQIRVLVEWKAAVQRMRPDETHVRSSALSRDHGCILSSYLHLPPIFAGGVPSPFARYGDYLPLNHGFRVWEQVINQYGGQVVRFGGQEVMAVFSDRDEEQDSFGRALQAWDVAESTLNDHHASAFWRPRSTTAILPALIVSGMFGSRTPGYPATIGRLEAIASQISHSKQLRPGVLGVPESWLNSESRAQFRNINGNRESRPMSFVDVNGEVEIILLEHTK